MRRDPTEINADEYDTIEQGIVGAPNGDNDGWEDVPMAENAAGVSNEAAVAAALRELLDPR